MIWRICAIDTEQSHVFSLRSSRFRFLQAKRGKRARALGKEEQKSRSPLLLFLLLFAKCPRVLDPLGLKETETTATQATMCLTVACVAELILKVILTYCCFGLATVVLMPFVAFSLGLVRLISVRLVTV